MNESGVRKDGRSCHSIMSRIWSTRHVSADRARKNQIDPVGVSTAGVWTHISADDGADSYHSKMAF